MNRSRLAALLCSLSVVLTSCGASGSAATGHQAGSGSTGAGSTAPASSASTAASTTTTSASSTTVRTTTTLAPVTTTPPPPPAGTGAYGAVTASPTCPVEQAGRPCPPQPVSTQIDVHDPSGHTVASTHSDSAGHYRVALAPGSYVLVTVMSGMFPRCPATPVTVTAGPPVRQDINCDTGIR
jgi:hypothetical protein